MNAEEFVEFLQAHAPSADALAEAGLDEDDIAEVLSKFLARRRPGGDVREFRSELERLVTQWDCASIEIATLGFLKSPGPFGDEGVQIARWEADPLVVAPDGRVVAYDHAEPETLAAACAVDSAAFLSALSIVVAASGKRPTTTEQFFELVSACARAAGEPESGSFFRTLVPAPR